MPNGKQKPHRMVMKGRQLPTLCGLVLLASSFVIAPGSATHCVAPNASSLSFCSTIGYMTPVQQPSNGSIDMDLAIESFQSSDAEASNMAAMMERVLERYDCSRKYSYHTCDDCKAAYRAWACAQKFPLCDASNKIVPTCMSLCQDVVRKCPYILSFECPAQDTKQYSHSRPCNDAGTAESNADFATTYRSGARALRVPARATAAVTIFTSIALSIVFSIL